MGEGITYTAPLSQLPKERHFQLESQFLIGLRAFRKTQKALPVSFTDEELRALASYKALLHLTELPESIITEEFFDEICQYFYEFYSEFNGVS